MWSVLASSHNSKQLGLTGDPVLAINLWLIDIYKSVFHFINDN